MAKRTGPPVAALNRFMADFEKSFGAGSLVVPTKRAYEVVSTGSLELDFALGCGGFVLGRITEGWGPGQVGKTTHAMIMAGEHQKAYQNRMVGWIDIERTYDPAWAEKNGMDLKRTHWFKPQTAEDVADAARKMIGSGLYSFIVLDSVGGMSSKAELDKNAEDAVVAAVARVVTRLVKLSAVLCDDNKTSLHIINQPRDVIGARHATQAGGGGNALKHVSTQKLRYRPTQTPAYTVGKGETKTEVGFEVAVHVERNKVAPPKKVAVFGMFYQDTEDFGPVGIDRAREAFNLGKRFGIIGSRPGGYYQLPDRETETRSEAKVMEALRENPALVDQIRTELLKHAGEVLDEIPGDIAAEAAAEDVEEPTTSDFKTGLPDHDLDREVLDRARNPEAISA